MKLLTVSAAFGVASAFVVPGAKPALPATAQQAKSQALPFLEAPPTLDGSYVGDVGFDPLQLSMPDWNMAELILPAARLELEAEDGKVPSIPMMYWMREAELKHGRVCMLAATGFAAVDLGLRFPGEKYMSITSSEAHNAMVSSGNMGFLLFVVSFIELISMPVIIQAAKGSGREAGDFAFDAMGFSEGTPEQVLRMKTAEVTHARLAMLGFSGMVTQAGLFGGTFPYIGTMDQLAAVPRAM